MNLYKRKEQNEFKKVGTTKLLWQGRNTKFDVVKINIDELKYNILNGRVAELDLSREVELDVATYEDIKNAIVKASKSDIEKLAKDIGKAKLQNPLIVNKDGVIVDGNRRYTAINMLLKGEVKPFSAADVTDLEDVEVVILDADSSSKSVKMLEYSIQFDDMKKQYDPISRAFDFARSHQTQKISIEEISESTGIKKTDIEKDIRTVKLIRVYLAAIGSKDDISLAIKQKLDGPFKEMASNKATTEHFLTHQSELVNIIALAKQGGGDITRVVRDFVKGQAHSKENIMNSPKVKKAVNDMAKEFNVAETVKQAAKATTHEEKIKIISAEGRTKHSQNVAQKISEFKNSMLQGQEQHKISHTLSKFWTFIKDADLSKVTKTDKDILEKIKDKI